MISQNIRETKQRLETLSWKIGSRGYFCPEVKRFYQEIQKRLDQEPKEIENWIKDQIPSFLEEVHPGKIYILVGILNILSLSTRIRDIIASQMLKILEKELKKLAKDPYYQYSPGGVDLRLCCINFLSDSFLQLEKEKQTHFLKICGEIKESENENVVVKQNALRAQEFISDQEFLKN